MGDSGGSGDRLSGVESHDLGHAETESPGPHPLLHHAAVGESHGGGPPLHHDLATLGGVRLAHRPGHRARPGEPLHDAIDVDFSVRPIGFPLGQRRDRLGIGHAVDVGFEAEDRAHQVRVIERRFVSEISDNRRVR